MTRDDESRRLADCPRSRKSDSANRTQSRIAGMAGRTSGNSASTEPATPPRGLRAASNSVRTRDVKRTAWTRCWLSLRREDPMNHYSSSIAFSRAKRGSWVLAATQSIKRSKGGRRQIEPTWFSTVSFVPEPSGSNE